MTPPETPPVTAPVTSTEESIVDDSAGGMTESVRPRRFAVVLTIAAALSAMFALAGEPAPPSAIVGLSVKACDTGLESGSGAFVAPGIVLTSAHVVAGARTIMVERPGSDRSMVGEIVGFDPINDIAYVAVADYLDPHLAQHHDLAVRRGSAGDVGTAYVVRHGEVVALPVEIARPVNIRTEDIYIDTMTNRPGFELVADIDAGDSGGVVVVDGKVIGIVWARSNLAADRAYAIDIVAGSAVVDAQLASGVIGNDAVGTPIDLARCY